MGWLPLLGGCAGDAPPPPPPAIVDRLDPVAHLVRASVAIRGTRPTVEELDAVRADPAALPGLIDAFLAAPEFGATVRDLWAEVLLLRNDTFNQLPALGPLADRDLDDLYQGTVEEPLRLVEYVITNDRPLTELLTADYMLTDDVTAAIYGVPYDAEVGGWQLSAWPDERPRAGLLSSAQLWRRWESDGSNFNRGRANLVAGRLLCEPFDARDIVVAGGVDIADEFEVAAAVVENPGCVSCHQSLDPLAGYFWGFKKLVHRNYVADSITHGCEFDWSETVPEFGTSYLPEDYCYPIRQYNPADEDAWVDWDLRAPSYYGRPLGDLADLGRAIADDPRFSQCMARQFYGYLAEVEPDAVPFPTAAALQRVLEGSGFDAKALVRAIVTDDGFTRRDGDGAIGGLLAVRPEQYARTIEDLTGFRWFSLADPAGCDDPANPDVQRFGTQCWGDVDLSDSDVFGFRAMAGGVDGKVILRPTHTTTPTKTLVFQKLAENAAGFVVDRDLAVPAADRRLLREVEGDTTDEGAVRAQLAWLHDRLLAEQVDPDGPEVDADLALFELGAGGAPAAGWKLVLTALLQDPRMMLY
ncbi:MAG: hypothetical protein ABMB14_32295 [Myxococcota bacterium]